MFRSKKRKIIFLLSLCVGNVFGQQVLYSVENGKRQNLGQMVVNYKQNGSYDVISGNKMSSTEITGNTIRSVIGNMVITTNFDFTGPYWHTDVGVWKVRSATTSLGGKGIAKVLYMGKTIIGRSYLEELWLDGHCYLKSEVVLDEKDQFVWLNMTSEKNGTLRIARK